MRGYSPREFKAILEKNGWKQSRKQNGSHLTYYKENVNYIVTFVDKGSSHGKELSRPMVKRIIKEAGLVV
jgi:predicted RNA binding protein YcfA (HicA-like mRNA interferase family)